MSDQPPRNVDELSLDWFNRVVGNQTGVVATAISVEPLGENVGFFASLAIVTPTYPPGKSAPAAFVAKFSANDPQARAAVSRINVYEREVDFYRHIAARSPVRVPACYFAHFDEKTGESLLIIEFVDGVCGDDLQGATYEQARLAIQTSAHLHSYWKGAAVLNESWLYPLVGPRFMRGMVEATREAVPLALQKLPGIAPDWLLQNAHHAPEIMSQQLAALNALPHTLIHFDYRVANMIFSPPEYPQSLTLIDWQFMLRGPGVVDVAFFCMTSLRKDRRRAWEDELVLGYLSEMEGREVREWPDWFREAWCRMAIMQAANMIRNVPVFDFENEGVVAFLRQLFDRYDAAVEDHAALRLLD